MSFMLGKAEGGKKGCEEDAATGAYERAEGGGEETGEEGGDIRLGVLRRGGGG